MFTFFSFDPFQPSFCEGVREIIDVEYEDLSEQIADDNKNESETENKIDCADKETNEND